MAWTFRNFATLILLLSSSFASATTLTAYLDNRAGLSHLGSKSYYQAYEDFLRALNSDPLNPDIQMNVGLSFEASEDYEKAEKAYMSAYELSKGDSAREFAALFNLAGARGRKSDIDGALQAYQKCLDINPESLEVKTNIELLWQQSGGKGKSKDGKDGKGDKDDPNKDDKDKDKDDKDQKKDRPYEQPKKQQPKPFEGKDLSKEDVRKILDEIQNQEQSIRAKEQDRGAKERPRDKDW
jgi:Ca-activated chloride channel homolog